MFTLCVLILNLLLQNLQIRLRGSHHLMWLLDECLHEVVVASKLGLTFCPCLRRIV